MENFTNTGSNDFQQLKLIHGALMTGAMVICLVLGVMMSKNGAVASFRNWADGLLMIASIVMGAEIIISFVLWKIRQSSIPRTEDYLMKWMHYRSSCILRWACLEGGVLITVILSYLAQNPAGFSIAAVGLGFLLHARPSWEFFAEQYGEGG